MTDPQPYLDRRPTYRPHMIVATVALLTGILIALLIADPIGKAAHDASEARVYVERV